MEVLGLTGVALPANGVYRLQVDRKRHGHRVYLQEQVREPRSLGSLGGPYLAGAVFRLGAGTAVAGFSVDLTVARAPVRLG